MSAFLVFLLHSIHIWKCHCLLVSPEFISITISSEIDGDNDCIDETLAIYEISLYADNEEISVYPEVANITNEGYLNDGAIRYSAYPTKCSFSIDLDLSLTGTEVDYLKLRTNCGDSSPSDFCDALIVTFYLTATQNVDFALNTFDLWPANNFAMQLVQYADDCDANTLLLDTAGPYAPCDLTCSECLDNLAVEQLSSDKWNLTTSTDNMTSICDCPSFTVKLDDEEDQELDIYTNYGSEYVGNLVAYSSEERVQLSLSMWKGQSASCKAVYIVETDDFLTVPYYQSLVHL